VEPLLLEVKIGGTGSHFTNRVRTIGTSFDEDVAL
jgi:hypothetical protein